MCKFRSLVENTSQTEESACNNCVTDSAPLQWGVAAMVPQIAVYPKDLLMLANGLGGFLPRRKRGHCEEKEKLVPRIIAPQRDIFPLRENLLICPYTLSLFLANYWSK